MKKYLIGFVLIASSCFGQGIRYDGNNTTAAKNVPVGAQANVMTLPYSTVIVCPYDGTDDPCTLGNAVSVYSDQALTHVLTQPIASDSQGRYGFWIATGVYKQSITSQAGTLVGTFALSLDSPVGPQGPGGIGCGAANCIVSAPAVAQSIAQPVGTTLNLNSFNSVIYAQPGASIASLCSGFTGAVVVTVPLSVTADATLPTTCAIEVKNGGSINIAAGNTLTINGDLAAGVYQIFPGPGAAKGLKVVRPEWFSGLTPTITGMQQALAACTGTTACQYLLQPTTYPAAFTSTPIAKDYVHFIGSGEGDYNSGNTAVVGGTILQGPLNVLANYFELHDACIDSGSALYPSSVENGFAMYNPTSTPGLPQWQSPLLQNVCVLGQNAGTADHAVLLENTNNAKVINLRTRFNQDGLVLKGTNTVVDGYVGSGHDIAGLYIKSDNYAITADVSVSNVHMSSVTAGDTVGFVIEGATANLARVTLNGFTGSNLSIGGLINSGVSTFATDITIQGLILDGTTQDGFKALGQVQRLKLENAVINNATGYGVTFQGGDVNYATVSNVQVTNAGIDGFNATGQYNKFSNDYTRSSGGYGFHLTGTTSSAWLDNFTSYTDTGGSVHADAGDTIFPATFPAGFSVGSGPTITTTATFAQYVGAITPTTTATTYTITAPSLPAGSHCFATPQNTTAAGMLATTYVPLNGSAGSTVVNTNGTAGGNFNVYCAFQ